MLTKSASFFLGSFLLAVVSCGPGDQPSRPPALNSTGSGGPVGSPDSGMGGQMTTDPGGEDSVTAVINAYADDSFLTSTGYDGGATVHVFNADATGTQSGSGPSTGVLVEQVELGVARLVLVQPDSVAEFFPTLTTQDISDGSITASVVPVSVIEGILSSLQSSTEINENAGHVALRIEDSGGTPVSGVEISFNSGGGEVAYKSGTVWFDGQDATDVEGQVFLLNQLAADLPGTDLRIILTGSVDEEVVVRVVRGAVTLVTLVVQ